MMELLLGILAVIVILMILLFVVITIDDYLCMKDLMQRDEAWNAKESNAVVPKGKTTLRIVK